MIYAVIRTIYVVLLYVPCMTFKNDKAPVCPVYLVDSTIHKHVSGITFVMFTESQII